ncbi:hypothetical protein BJX99DRAFT_231007 [Aspergillus californicus]
MVNIRSTMNDGAQAHAVAMFNNKNEIWDVSLTTFAVGAHGLNLHSACARVVLLEPALHLRTMLQAIG